MNSTCVEFSHLRTSQHGKNKRKRCVFVWAEKLLLLSSFFLGGGGELLLRVCLYQRQLLRYSKTTEGINAGTCRDTDGGKGLKVIQVFP